jgi:uncharacterized protein (TIGR02246 family)
MRHNIAGKTLIVALLVTAFQANARDSQAIDKKVGKESSVTTELERLSERWYRGWLDRDAATVEHMMADDYVYITPTGQTQNRDAILRIIRSPGYRLHQFTRTNIVVRMLGDGGAVIRSRGQGEGEFDGKRFKDDHALVQVWARINGEWKVVVEQATANKP